MNTDSQTPTSPEAIPCARLADAAGAIHHCLTANVPDSHYNWLPNQRISFAPLNALQHRFQLNDFESSLILLLALENTWPASLSPLFRSGKSSRLSFLNMQVFFPGSFNPESLLEHAPLRHWKLIEFTRNGLYAEPLISRPLEPDERILGYLLGTSHPDCRLEPYLDLSEPIAVLTPTQQKCSAEIATLWSKALHFNDFPLIALRGPDPDALRAIAWDAARTCGLSMIRLRAEDLPTNREERLMLFCLWQREALLSNRSLYLDLYHTGNRPAEAPLTPAALSESLYSCGGARIIAHFHDLPLPPRAVVMEAPPTRQEDRRTLIKATLNGHAPDDPTFIEQLAGHFELGAVALYQACSTANTTTATDHGKNSAQILWEECRRLARPRLGPLVQHILSRHTWDDLVLPDEQIRLLREAVTQVQHRSKVYHDWGFADKCCRGLNLTALFSGPSGTGKTLAAEVVANALGLDLLRIDLSAVVSKYIGETEEHLRSVFDAAEPGGAVLLFDEADALFSPRSEVTDSRDRNANIEVSYLLQRLECYRGLAILTTNFKENIDNAFLRRIRFHVEFPFPDRHTRSRIWRTSFPQRAPLGEVSFDQLGRLSLTGGHIHNIALNAAFLAAHDNCPIHNGHIVSAARSEFRKSEKPVPESELRLLAPGNTTFPSTP